jgi:predicted nucleotidyltransferase
VERELVDAFLQVYGDDLVSLVLFGSYARGEQRKDSDIDVLVVLREIRDRYDVMMKFLKVEDILERTLFPKLREIGYDPYLSPVIYDVRTATKFRPLYLAIAFDAKVLYDRGNVMTETLARVKKKLDELGAKRERFGRGFVVTLTKVRPGEVVVFE